MSLTTVLGLILAFALGVVTALFKIPAPAPANLTGAFMVVAVTVGYLITRSLLHI